MRTVFREEPGMPPLSEFKAAFGELARRFEMDWEIHDTSVPQRVLILVSKFDHCLNDLLYRYRTGDSLVDIAGCRLEPSGPCSASWSGTASPITTCR